MSEGNQASGLQLEPNMKHERREWRVQRFGWLGLALSCGAALAGLLGPGPLSQRHEGKIGSALYFEYERFVRYRAPSSLKVYCRLSEARDEFTLSLNRAWVEKVQIKGIQPEPIKATAAGENYVFQFELSGNDEQLVTIQFEPDTFGSLNGTLALDEKVSHRFKQFVWP